MGAQVRLRGVRGPVSVRPRGRRLRGLSAAGAPSARRRRACLGTAAAVPCGAAGGLVANLAQHDRPPPGSIRELRAHAPPDRRAVRRRLDARGLSPQPARVQPARRRLLLRRPAEGGGQGRPRRASTSNEVNLEVRGRVLVIIAASARRATPRAASTSRSRSSRAPSRARSSSAPTWSPTRRAPPTRTGSCGSSCRSPSRARGAARCRSVRAARTSGERRSRDRGRRRAGDEDDAVDVERDVDAARRAAGPSAEGDGRLPEHDDAAGRRPGAFGAARERRARRATACS